MLKKSITITCPRGLEPRPIAELVQVASKYDSKVYLETADKHVNAKSIMGMMSLQLNAGDEIIVSVDGHDQLDALADMEEQLARLAG